MVYKIPNTNGGGFHGFSVGRIAFNRCAVLMDEMEFKEEKNESGV